VTQRIVGILLAGGASTRMGRDKAYIQLRGETMFKHSVELLRGVASEIAVSGRDPAPMGVDAPWFEDAIKGIGPMGGIIAALERFHAPCLCISLDMPFLNRDILVMLLWARENRGEDRVMTTFHDPETGYIESLVAIYEPEALPLLTASAAAGIYKLSAAIPFEKRQHIPFPMDAQKLFMNINSPDDLNRFNELDASREQG